jgi:hypothetical protein
MSLNHLENPVRDIIHKNLLGIFAGCHAVESCLNMMQATSQNVRNSWNHHSLIDPITSTDLIVA